MWPKRQSDHARLIAGLEDHARKMRSLPGANDDETRFALAMQIVASLRREAYYQAVQQKTIAASKADPNSGNFDPERAVAYHLQQGNIEEACWLIFMMTHFARPVTGWDRLRDVYGMLGAGTWDWNTVSQDPKAMIDWLSENWRQVAGKFGNHRKYESIRPDSNRSFGKVLNSYLLWVGQAGHQKFFGEAVRKHGNDPKVIFDELFRTMRVTTFGRLAKFDYLAMIGRYRIAPLEAGSAYLEDATGPKAGVRLLFLGDASDNSHDRELQSWLDDLDLDLAVGMEVLEDALCNWQKSPRNFVHYKG
ncbi:MAG: hypothetical protein PGN20_11510 [Agrobacterium cavarae]